MELPEEILAYIFSFLPLGDRSNACSVCNAWSHTMSHPCAWKHTEVRCEPGVNVSLSLSAFLPIVRHLKLFVCLTDPASRSSVLDVIHKAVANGDGRLQSLSVSGLGNPRLFDAGHDLLQGLVDELEGGAMLTSLDLRGVPFTLNDAFVKGVVKCCPTLQSLFINNHSLVCGVTTETMREVLKVCPALSALGAFHASLSPRVIDDMLSPGRPKLRQLQLRCERSLKYSAPLCDEAWAALRRRHPDLWVELVLDHTITEPRIPLVLQPSIPLRRLRLLTWTYLIEEIHFVGSTYADTLELLELQTPPSPELNSALITLAWKCRSLREVHCYCVVSQEVITAFQTSCFHLQRYTLKTIKEPHPWVCTVLK